MIGFALSFGAAASKTRGIRKACRLRSSDHGIEYVTCDVDGTLLNSKHNVDGAVANAVGRTLENGVKFVCATGKSRQGSLNSIGPDLEKKIREAYGGEVPGVFLQGLIVYGLDGKIVHERLLSSDMAQKLADASREHGVTVVAYSADRILCEEEDDETRKLKPYKEPTPEPIGRWEDVIGKLPIHKMMYLAPVADCERFRPVLEKIVGDEAKITQAMRDMIEVLPPNASKGYGVERFLESFNADPAKLLAIGDAENDLEMLKLAKYGIAMGNGFDSVKEVADDIVLDNDNAGVAVALEKYVLDESEDEKFPGEDFPATRVEHSAAAQTA
uniref:Uncharacterized protein n=1 Tax=Rhodosorus marinus TaxID=101924 RepID=A0A7S2ZAW7_9RHOD|mmetsp:Transcript_12828/g.51390  ORF Transcript_12828/g.51390 Transcript_12828/m.51390 type:complete len:329 (+) Transcript_12828:118-1104(+)